MKKLNIIERFIKLALLLNEGRLEDTIKRYPELEAQIKQFSDTDPSGNLKYLTWQIRQLKLDEPLEEIIEMTSLFHNFAQRLEIKDINRYITLADLREKIEGLSQSKASITKAAKAGAKKIYEDDTWLVINPTTTEASKTYGKGTRWCIAASASHNYFASYAQKNLWFYFLIDKTKENVSHGSFEAPEVNSKDSALNKIAFPMNADGSVYIHDIRDSKDILISQDQVADHIGEKVWEKMFASIKADVNGKGDTTEYTMYIKDRSRQEFLRDLRTTSNRQVIDENIPLSWEDRSLRSALAGNTNVSPTILAKYLKKAQTENDNEITTLLFRNNSLAPEVIQREYDRAKVDGNIFFVDAMLSNTNLPETVRDDVILNGVGLETSYTVQSLVRKTLEGMNASVRLPYMERILASNKNISSVVFKIFVNAAETIEELRALLKHTENAPLKKFFIKNHPVAMAYQKQKAGK